MPRIVIQPSMSRSRLLLVCVWYQGIPSFGKTASIAITKRKLTVAGRIMPRTRNNTQ